MFSEILSGGRSEIGYADGAIRTVLVYLIGLAIIRLGSKRFFGKNTAFDTVVGFMLGSIFSRAITGNAPFLPALECAAVLVAMHWAMGWLAVRWHLFGVLVKGRHRRVVDGGRIHWDQMRKGHLSLEDLESALRLRGRIREIDRVEQAWLERSGEISVVPMPREPQVVYLRVEQGVQVVRIELTPGS